MTKTILLGYYRKSVIDGPTASPDRQRHAIEQWASRNGFSQVEWFGDLDISGRHEANRPEWQKLLQRLSDPRVAGVAVESYDRSHRNVREFLAFYDDILAPRGLRLISATQNMDLSNADGRFMATVMMAYSENESRKASERMSATVRYKREVLGRHWGKIPFGCDRHPETFHLIPSSRFYYYNPATGETQTALLGEPPAPPAGFEIRYYYDALSEMYRLYATGSHSYNDTAHTLNAAGWRSWLRDRTTPTPWNTKHVVWGTDNADTYAGRIDGQPAGHKPILPVELCEAVAAARQARAGVRNPGNNRTQTYIYLLSGLMVCETCGRGLAGQKSPRKKTGHFHYYRHLYSKGPCPEEPIGADQIEGQVISLLQGMVKGDLMGEVQARLKTILELAAASSEDNSAAAKLLAKEVELERLVRLHITGRISLEQFDRLEEELKGEIAGLKRQVSLVTGTQADVDWLGEELIERIGHLEKVSREKQRNIICSIIEQITISNRAISSITPTVGARPFFEFCVNFPADQTLRKSSHLLILDLIELS